MGSAPKREEEGEGEKIRACREERHHSLQVSLLLPSFLE